jgi:predicted nucleic acid-binding protein
VLEVLKAGAAVLFAPPEVITEVNRHLGELAARIKSPRAVVDEAWCAVRRQIVFVPVPRSAFALESLRALRDRAPSDLSIAALALRLRADGVVTRDRDFMAVPELQRVSGPDLLQVRAVARTEAEQTGTRLSVTVAGSLVFRGGIALWQGWPWLVAGIVGAVFLVFVLCARAREVVGELLQRDRDLDREREQALALMPRSLAAALLPGGVV